jgi:hypothetical protein
MIADNTRMSYMVLVIQDYHINTGNALNVFPTETSIKTTPQLYYQQSAIKNEA